MKKIVDYYENKGRNKTDKVTKNCIRWSEQTFSAFDGETDKYLVEVKDNSEYTLQYGHLFVEVVKLKGLINACLQRGKHNFILFHWFGERLFLITSNKIKQLLKDGKIFVQKITARANHFNQERKVKEVVLIPLEYCAVVK